MADIRSRALGHLREGHVAILYARTRATDTTPCEVVARVQGHTARHQVELRPDGRWLCSCTPVVMDDGSECAHRAAVALTTGHLTTAAAKPKASTP